MLSLIIPIYKNEANLPPLLDALKRLSEEIEAFEAVFVVDGSPDRSFEVLDRELRQVPYASQLIGLSRNFGSFSAIRAGLRFARGERFAVMAADLQEPPELVVEFNRILSAKDADVVFGQRRSRKDPVLSRAFSTLFWGLYRRFVEKNVPKGGVDIFACNAKVREEILRLPERNSSLLGLLLWVGFRRASVPYDRRPREIGKSAWTFRKKLRYLVDSVFGFTDLPIKLLTYVGSIALFLSVAFTFLVVFRRMVNSIPVPGYAATVLLVTFFGALNCLGLGIIGGYVWRTFENTKLRPDHIVAEHRTFNDGISHGIGLRTSSSHT